MSIHYTYTIHKHRMCNHMKHKIIQAKTSEKIWKEFELPKPYVNTSETSFKKYLIASKKKKEKKIFYWKDEKKRGECGKGKIWKTLFDFCFLNMHPNQCSFFASFIFTSLFSILLENWQLLRSFMAENWVLCVF